MNTMIGRRVDPKDDLELPGDYVSQQIIADGVTKPVIWFLLPIHVVGDNIFSHKPNGSGIHGVQSPPWTFIYHDDDSIEVIGSIACGEPRYFHGWLKPGHVWEWE